MDTSVPGIIENRLYYSSDSLSIASSSTRISQILFSIVGHSLKSNGILSLGYIVLPMKAWKAIVPCCISGMLRPVFWLNISGKIPLLHIKPNTSSDFLCFSSKGYCILHAWRSHMAFLRRVSDNFSILSHFWYHSTSSSEERVRGMIISLTHNEMITLLFLLSPLQTCQLLYTLLPLSCYVVHPLGCSLYFFSLCPALRASLGYDSEYSPPNLDPNR